MASTSGKRTACDDASTTAQLMELDLQEPDSSSSAAALAAHGHSPMVAEDECGATSASSSTRRQNLKVHWAEAPSKPVRRRHAQAQSKKRALARRAAPCLALHKHAPPANLTLGSAVFCQVGTRCPQELQRRSGCEPSAFSKQARKILPPVARHRSLI